MSSAALFPEVDQILSLLDREAEQDMVVLVVPSHDKGNEELKDQDQWAAAAEEVFANLYGGATSFMTHGGIFKDEHGTIYRDKPIVIECYASNGHIEDPKRLTQLIEFARRMGRETKQKSVMLAFGLVMFYVDNFEPAKGES